jgi:hypothetical protein
LSLSSRITFYHHRTRRAAASVEDQDEAETTASKSSISPVGEETDLDKNGQMPRQARGGWCAESFGVFCMLYNAFKGNKENAEDRIGDEDIPSLSAMNSLDSPMTPCPSAVEYVTPVFAKNYQGVWRYVVQIPYEGYFTQTVEVVKCL